MQLLDFRHPFGMARRKKSAGFVSLHCIQGGETKKFRWGADSSDEGPKYGVKY